MTPETPTQERWQESETVRKAHQEVCSTFADSAAMEGNEPHFRKTLDALCNAVATACQEGNRVRP